MNMINVILKGMDIFLAKDFEEKMTVPLAKLINVNEREIFVTTFDSFVYHYGIDQTSMHLFIDVECPFYYERFEDKIASFLLELSKQFSIHTHLIFKYFDDKKLHEAIDHQYPLFLDNSNIANVERVQENEENVEIFDGNAFKDFEHLFPNELDEDDKKH